MSITRRVRKNGSVVYEIRISRGRDPVTGKQLTPFTTTYTPPTGCPEAKAKKLAQKAEAVFEEKCKNGEVEVKSEKSRKSNVNITERPAYETLDSLLPILTKDLTPNSVRSYRWVIGLIKQFDHDVTVQNIDAVWIEHFSNWLRLERTLKPASLIVASATVRAILQKLFDAGFLESVPAPRKVSRSNPKSKRAAINVRSAEMLSDDELMRFLHKVDSLPIIWKTVFTFLLESGSRIGECNGLQWQDVDLDTGHIVIRNNLQHIKGGEYYITTPKSGRIRHLYLDPNGKSLSYLRQMHLDKQYVDESEYVFHMPGHRHLGYHSAYVKLRRLGQQINISHLHPHMLRHTMASLSIQSGVDLATTSQMLGHSSPHVTANIYLHTNESRQQEGGHAISSALKRFSK